MTFVKAAGRATARLVLRRTLLLGIFATATFPVWHGTGALVR